MEKYSVIMSVYSKVNPNHLYLSINSILSQSYPTDDFIIIKDGQLSDELNNTIDTFAKSNSIIRIFEFEKNVGAGEAYNLGIEKCKNKWASIMDSDDIAKSDKFEKQMNFLSQNKNIDVIGSNAIEFINEPTNIISTRIMPELNDDIIRFAHSRCPLIQPTVIFYVDKVKKCGSYQHSPLTEDYDLYIRMIKSNCVFYTYQEVLYYIRTSDDFFKRRGGFGYLKKIVSFKYKHFKNGFFSFPQFMKTTISSCVVSLMPNFLRERIYKKFLRN